jgi:heat shock protein HslJ
MSEGNRVSESYEEWSTRDREINRKRWIKRLIVIAVALLIIFIEPPLVGSKWELVEINGAKPLDTPLPITAEFRFTILGPAMTGSTGCNYYESVYLRISMVLKILLRNITSMGCDVLDQEAEILSIMQDALIYHVSGGKLTMRSMDDRELVFVRK